VPFSHALGPSPDLNPAEADTSRRSASSAVNWSCCVGPPRSEPISGACRRGNGRRWGSKLKSNRRQSCRTSRTLAHRGAPV